jgi:hypothetical protein
MGTERKGDVSGNGSFPPIADISVVSAFDPLAESRALRSGREWVHTECVNLRGQSCFDALRLSAILCGGVTHVADRCGQLDILAIESHR